MTESHVEKSKARPIPITSIAVAHEVDIVTARQRARQLARLLGFDAQDQIRLATATSEIARNAFQYAGSGRVDFSVELNSSSQSFVVQVSDRGPGIENASDILEGHYHSRTGLGLGIPGTRRLVDHFSLQSAAGEGTKVIFAKFLPGPRATPEDIKILTRQLASERPSKIIEELQQQNRELLAALETVRNREAELDQRQSELQRLNQELEDTNRGVVALYAELDERAEALRAANEIKTRFLSHMSHEFRTPLNAILALAGLLQRHTDGELTAGQEKQVGFIRRAAEELFELVNDLLDLAKVESGKLDLKLSDVNLAQLFGALRGMLRPLSHSDSVGLYIEDPPPDLTITTDEGKLAQILRNLVSNALKFTESGEVRVSVARAEGQVVFSVADTGIGIPPSHQQLIFEEFKQLDNPIQRRVKGTGLGLPLSRKLAELMGGSLTVWSEPGVGSVFSLSLPCGEPDSAEKTVHAVVGREPVDSEIPGSVLVIDDEEIARYIVRQMFHGTRHRIIEASTGSEGAERARFEKPRLILLDLRMPGQNGFEVFDELQADPSTRSIPVVIHTSQALRPEDLERLAGRHAAVLPKQPHGREHAQNFIRELLGEPQLFSSDAS